MRQECWINGKWVRGASLETIAVSNPATDEEVGTVPNLSARESNRAFDASSAAFPSWSDTSQDRRSELLHSMARLMVERRESLAQLVTLEQGKPLVESRGEVDYAASFLTHAAEEAKSVVVEERPAPLSTKRILIVPRPVGVTAAITPWNFPLAMITRKLGPALAVGCTQVVKPAEQTPLCALALAEIAAESAFPDGVVNIVTTDGPLFSKCAFSHPSTRLVSFTGSTEVGRILIEQSAKQVIRLSLELGGQAAFIVFEDANIALAARQCALSKFRNAGQTCICANRIFVHESILEPFTKQLCAIAAAIRVGPGTHEGVTMGPLIDDDAVSKALRHIDNALSLGARVETGGARLSIPGFSQRFLQPTVLSRVTDSMLCCREETFSPIAPILSFTTEDEVIERANATPFGLSAYFCTRDEARIQRVAPRLEAGVIGVNDGAPSTSLLPFGGIKQSGYGREGGAEGVREFCELRAISWNTAVE
ncbi:MAG: NAD-dependent succinate-semialdehyde dehydrogenase [Planctomycetota bacterium]|nr:NAD-dependent succinate-semialdehyde dehydrogenase [Planctomycetota bacterium]